MNSDRTQRSRASVSTDVSASPPATAESGVDVADANRPTRQVLLSSFVAIETAFVGGKRDHSSVHALIVFHGCEHIQWRNFGLKSEGTEQNF